MLLDFQQFKRLFKKTEDNGVLLLIRIIFHQIQWSRNSKNRIRALIKEKTTIWMEIFCKMVAIIKIKLITIIFFSSQKLIKAKMHL